MPSHTYIRTCGLLKGFSRLWLTGIALALALAVFSPRPLIVHAAGTTYYLSPSGSDSNSGTSAAAPWRTIQKAVDLVGPGDVLSLAPGVYLQDVISRRNGTAGAPITVTGPATAVIKGAGKSHVFEVNHDYLSLDGFTLDGLFGSATSSSGYRNKLLYMQGKEPFAGVTGLKVRNLTFQNAGGECLRFRYFAEANEVTASTFKNCGVYDFKFNGGGKNGEAIYIGTAPEQLADGKNPTADPDVSTDNWIHHNTFDTQSNECVDIKEAATRNIVEHNTCTGQKDANSGGFDARGSGNVFGYNESHGNMGAGIRLGGDTSTDGTGNDVYGNNLHDNGYGGVKFQRSPQGIICGNTSSNNSGGDETGTDAALYDITRPCDEGEITATPAPSTSATSTPPGATPIPTPTGSPADDCATSTTNWRNTAFAVQHGTFTAAFDITPHAASMDGITGLSSGAATDYTDLALIVRFNKQGYIDARNGSSYEAAKQLPYTVGTTYRVRFVVRVPSHTYDIFVTPAGGNEHVIGMSFAFRTEQASVTSLNTWALFAAAGSHNMCNFSVSAEAARTSTPTATRTNTPPPTSLPTSTATPTATSTPLPTATRTSTPMPTALPTSTATPTRTATPLPTTPMPTSTATPIATSTPASEAPIREVSFEEGRLIDPDTGVDRTSGTVALETAAPLKGRYAAGIPNTANSYLEVRFPAADDLYASFSLRVAALPTSDMRIALLSNAGTTVGNIILRPTGALGLRTGSTTVGSGSAPLQVGTAYRVGLRQKKGTGRNAVLEGYLAEGDASVGTPFAALTNGTWTASVDRLRVGSTMSVKVDATIDDITLLAP